MNPSAVPARAGLTSDDVERLGALGRYEDVRRRAVVRLDGDRFVLVASGFFRIFRSGAFARDVTLGLAIEGDVLGAAAAYDARPGETGIEALSAGRVLVLAPEVWREQAARDPELSLRCARSLGRRLSQLQKKLEEYARADAAMRVATTLRELAADFGTPSSEGVRLDLPFSQDDLARLAGTTRETCSSIVAALARSGVVRGGRLHGMVVTDPEALQTAAEGGEATP